MRVPPPYVPPLLNGAQPAYAGAERLGYLAAVTIAAAAAPAAEVVQKQAPEPALSLPERKLPRWTQMTNRERLFLALLLTLLIILPSAVPNSGVGRATANSSQSLSQPSERAGENFPGSAFYFTDPNFATPRNYANASENSLTGPADANYTLPGLAPGNSMGVDGPLSANQITPAVFRGSADDNMRALQCLTQAVYYEAASEPDAGQRAVAQVVLNRVRHPAYPRTVCGVVYQGSERRTGCQFTFTCDGSLRRTPSAFFWERARRVAADALAGRIGSPVGTATHYHTTEVSPYWAPSLRFLGTIGAHRFYSWKGGAGNAAAFGQRYTGGEPVAAPRPRSFEPLPSDTLDPVALEKVYETARAKAEADAAKAAAALAQVADNARRHNLPEPVGNTSAAATYRTPDYSDAARKHGGDNAFAGQKMPDVSRIKPEYQNSGTWKAKPGG